MASPDSRAEATRLLARQRLLRRALLQQHFTQGRRCIHPIDVFCRKVGQHLLRVFPLFI
ncbi:MAG: hypothetical protein ACK4MJ_12225 [Hylemonella sp.]